MTCSVFSVLRDAIQNLFLLEKPNDIVKRENDTTQAFILKPLDKYVSNVRG